MHYCPPLPPCESEKLEVVITCVGFDDMLDVTLGCNHPHFDHVIVVTTHDDKKTGAVARKHGVTLVTSDLFGKNKRRGGFNKGAAINHGFGHFQHAGWRMHMDADIVVPDNFRRLLFNHTKLDKSCIYGADRVNVIGRKEIEKIKLHGLQHIHSLFVESCHHGPIGARYVDPLFGYVPIGFFQLWNYSCQKPYPHTEGTAAHDDVMFASLWPETQRRVLPTGVVYHLCQQEPKWGENWKSRKHPRLK